MSPIRKRSVPRTIIASLALAGAVTAGAMTPAVADPVDTSPSVKAFQDDHGLSTSGTIDQQTARELLKTNTTERTHIFAAATDLTDEQIGNARTIIGVGKGAEIPEAGIKIALITALQESSLLNLDYGDADSLGLFQQRPSQGWGTPEQIMNPVLSSQSFYGVAPFGPNPGLIQIDGWQSMLPGDAAQAVQRSAYPRAYDKWIPLADQVFAEEAGSVDPIS